MKAVLAAAAGLFFLVSGFFAFLDYCDRDSERLRRSLPVFAAAVFVLALIILLPI